MVVLVVSVTGMVNVLVTVMVLLIMVMIIMLVVIVLVMVVLAAGSRQPALINTTHARWCVSFPH